MNLISSILIGVLVTFIATLGATLIALTIFHKLPYQRSKPKIDVTFLEAENKSYRGERERLKSITLSAGKEELIYFRLHNHS